MLTAAMHVLSFIGSAAFYAPMLAIIYWSVNRRVGARLAVLLILAGLVNILLKLVFHDPRPFWTDPLVTGYQPADSFGMPSGHAEHAVVVWGLLASLTRHPPAWAGALALVAGIGMSRVVLGVHSSGQVLAGWAIGAGILITALALEPRVVPWWSRRPFPVQIALSLGVALAFVAGLWGAVQGLADWTWPAAWWRAIVEAGGGVEPISLGEGAAVAGALFGVLSGLSYGAHHRLHDTGGDAWRRLARIPVGAAGALALFTVSLFLGTDPGPAFVGTALMGVWAAAGAPLVFVRLRLADRRTPRLLTRPGEEHTRLRQ